MNPLLSTYSRSFTRQLSSRDANHQTLREITQTSYSQSYRPMSYRETNEIARAGAVSSADQEGHLTSRWRDAEVIFNRGHPPKR